MASEEHITSSELHNSKLDHSYSISYLDFWPKCLGTTESLTNSTYESFDNLLPRVNEWLRDHPNVEVIKCETIEDKLESTHHLGTGCMKFDVLSQKNTVYFLKGLRLWFTTEIPILPGCSRPRSHAQQIGYRNFVPHCADVCHKYPIYEQLSVTYVKMNEKLLEHPLEGKILSVETVPFRLARPSWTGPDISINQSNWLDYPTYHILYITRIFFIFECPAYEQIGAADFLPDICEEKYQSFQSIFAKINSWLENVKDIRVTNIQTLEASTSHSEKVNTGLNFLVKADTLPSVRFLRVSYVRPKYGLPPGGLNAPKGLFYKTVVPSIIEPQSAESSTHFEDENVVWNRILSWMTEADMCCHQLVSVEMTYHPMTLICKKKDQGETTVIKGTWVFGSPEDGKECGVHRDDMVRLPLLKLFRLYFDSTPKRLNKKHHSNNTAVHIPNQDQYSNVAVRPSNQNPRPQSTVQEVGSGQEQCSNEQLQTSNQTHQHLPADLPLSPQQPQGTCFPFVCSK